MRERCRTGGTASDRGSAKRDIEIKLRGRREERKSPRQPRTNRRTMTGDTGSEDRSRNQKSYPKPSLRRDVGVGQRSKTGTMRGLNAHER